MADSYVVLDKPAGTTVLLFITEWFHEHCSFTIDQCADPHGHINYFLQVGGTTDNIEESCATFASRALDLAEPLKTTHQIDNCTEGWYLLSLSKTSLLHTFVD